MKEYIDYAFYSTLDVLRRKNIRVYLHPKTPLQGNSVAPMVSAKHFALGFTPENPLDLDNFTKLEDVLALACDCTSVIITRDRSTLWVQYTLPEEFWTTVYYEDLEGGGIGVLQTGETVKYAFDDAYSHAIIAGSSGSGKSQFMRTIIRYLVDTHPPEDLRLSIVDPNSEFTDMQGMRHLIHPVAGRPEDIRDVIQGFAEELASRYESNERSRVRAVLVIDEAQSDMVFGTEDSRKGKNNQLAPFNKDNLNDVLGISRMGRKYAINLIIGTQKPNHADLPGVLSNLTYTFIGKTFDPAEAARLGGAGTPGHKLLGKGDFFLKTPYGVQRFQAALIRDNKYPRGVLPSPFKPYDPVTGKITPPVLAEYLKGGVTAQEAKERFNFDEGLHGMYVEFAEEVKLCM